MSTPNDSTLTDASSASDSRVGSSDSSAGISFGRRVLNVGFRRVLQCRCDAATLVLPLPAPMHGSFCQYCDLTNYKPNVRNEPRDE